MQKKNCRRVDVSIIEPQLTILLKNGNNKNDRVHLVVTDENVFVTCIFAPQWKKWELFLQFFFQVIQVMELLTSLE